MGKVKQKNKARSFSHRTILLVLLVTSLLVGITITMGFDLRRRAIINDKMDDLLVEFEKAGLNGMKKSSGCGETNAKFDSGDRVCNVGLELRLENVDEATATDYVNRFLLVMNNQHILKQETSVATAMPTLGDNKYADDGARYIETVTNSICSGSFTYVGKSNFLLLNFHCENESLFDRILP